MDKIESHRSIRKYITALGNIFSGISIGRYNPDGSEQERFLVPLVFAPKEKYIQRLEEDLNLDKKTQITLPRMSYELTGFQYDASRKLNTNIQNYSTTNSGYLNFSSQYNPVPYDFKFSLYIYVRNYEDVTQITEHILSYFAPDYTIKINLVPEMGIVKEVPIIMNGVQMQMEYEGPRESDPRLIIWTLTFTLKGYIFGPVLDSSKKLIKHSITNIYTGLDISRNYTFTMDSTGSGDYIPGEWVFQGYSLNTATATAKVVSWNPHTHTLNLTDLKGNFVPLITVIGSTSLATYLYTNYVDTTEKLAQIDCVVDPYDVVIIDPWSGNTSVPWKANTTIQEFYP